MSPVARRVVDVDDMVERVGFSDTGRGTADRITYYIDMDYRILDVQAGLASSLR